MGADHAARRLGQALVDAVEHVAGRNGDGHLEARPHTGTYHGCSTG
jgi:hypothetical protein